MPSSVRVPFSQMFSGVTHDLIVNFDGVSVEYRDQDGFLRNIGNTFDMYKSIKNCCYTYSAGWNVQPKGEGGYIPVPWKQTVVAKRSWAFIRPERDRVLAELPANELAMLRRLYGNLHSVPQIIVEKWQQLTPLPIFTAALTDRAALYAMCASMPWLDFSDTNYTYPAFGPDPGGWREVYCFDGKMSSAVWQTIHAIPGRINFSWVHNLATWHLPRAIYNRAEWAFMAAASDRLVNHWNEGIGDSFVAWRMLDHHSPHDFVRSLDMMPKNASIWNKRSYHHMHNFYTWLFHTPLASENLFEAVTHRLAEEEAERERMLRREKEYLERRRQRIERSMAQEAAEGGQAGMVRTEQLNDESLHGLFGDVGDDRWAARNLGVVL